MAQREFQDMLDAPSTGFWPKLAAIRTPLIAAVSGYALGGGCELALACDMIVASERAELGQPEILLGIIPGGGGTQRLARVLGKQQAMELVLTGRRISALEAHQMGLVNKVSKAKDWLNDALDLAAVVARRPPLAARLAKQAVLAADETTLSGGPRPGAAPVRAGDGHRGPRGGHAGVRGEAQAGVPRPVSAEAPGTLGVVGAGTMGAGIAQLGCAAGMRVLMHDPVPDALERGLERVRGGLARWVEKGRLAADAAGPLEAVDALEGLGPCELVIEAAPERPELKRDLFARLSQVCGEQAVLASNTSSITITSIAGAAAPARERRGYALLQPAAADGAPRGDPRRPDRRARAGRGAGGRRRRWARR